MVQFFQSFFSFFLSNTVLSKSHVMNSIEHLWDILDWETGKYFWKPAIKENFLVFSKQT